MRVYPTFPNEETGANLNNFIEGAKRIWDN